jgi:putative transposase
VTVDFIDQHKTEFGVEPVCAVLKDAGVQIAPSSYYAAKSRPLSARAIRDAELITDIRTAHKANLGVYGARKIHAELNRKGLKVARCTVERLMKADGLRGIPREKTRKTTVGDGAETARPEDLVERKFVATGPNALWVADLTYVRTHAGWTYVAFVLDVFSRMIVGWQVSTTLRTDLALDALEMGLWSRQRAGQDVTGLIHHSDRGVQGEINRSSQHPIMEVLSGASSTGSGSGGPAEAALAWSSEVPASRRGRVLGRDRQGATAHRSRCGGRRGASGRSAVVPQRWRHAALRSEVRANRPLPVVC